MWFLTSVIFIVFFYFLLIIALLPSSDFVLFPSGNDEVKKKMYSCILIVGGGLMFRGAQGWIQHRLWSQLPAQFRYTLETMDVITRAKVKSSAATA